MSWVSILAVMFTAKVLLLLAALPVAFVFFIINIGGSYLIFGGIPGLEADGAQRADLGGAVFAGADSAVRADGRGAVSHWPWR